MAVEKCIDIFSRKLFCTTSGGSLYDLEAIPTKFLGQDTVVRVGRDTVCHRLTKKVKSDKKLLLVFVFCCFSHSVH